VVITVQDVHKDISSGAFRVGGIYDTPNGMFNEMNIFVRFDELATLLDTGGEVHEIAALVSRHEDAVPVTDYYQVQYSGLSVESWMDLSTGMRFMVEAMDSYMVIIVGIVLLALLFGIVNTMLMSILERTRELGMLMCVGMSRLRIFSMILMETLMLSATGGPLGILLAWITVNYFSDHGIDLGPFAQVYQDLGYAPVIYPLMNAGDMIVVSIMVLVMAVLASVFPAYKGLKLKPVEALNKL
jgi:ABC-type lipoprotein release transport system permease subunit